MALIELAQTLFTLVATVDSGSPALIRHCRAGFWPRFAERTLPKMTSSISSGLIPARSIAEVIATDPRSDIFWEEREPMNMPVGVRAAERM